MARYNKRLAEIKLESSTCAFFQKQKQKFQLLNPDAGSWTRAVCPMTPGQRLPTNDPRPIII